MQHPIIDKETVYCFDNAKLTHYHTNVPCVEDYVFDKYLIAMMLSGNKDIVWKDNRIRFEPNTIFIPPKDTKMTVEIDYATFSEPADCIVLDISDDFVFNLYLELKDKWKLEWESIGISGIIDQFYHFTSSNVLCDSFQKFYSLQKKRDQSTPFLIELSLKEISFLLLQSSACKTILEQSSPVKNSPFFEAVNHIKTHFSKPIKVEELAKKACMSTSVFYKKFKENLGCTPNDYVTLERIKNAKTLIGNTNLSFAEIAFKSGFNSPEYFYRKFKTLVKFTPSEYRHLSSKSISIE